MDASAPTPVSVLVTVAYTGLIVWGVAVAARQAADAFGRPSQLLNPLFGNRPAARLFTFHIVVVSADLFLIGPLSLAHKSELWYWGGRVALLSSSLPLAAFFNRTAVSFGHLIGTWIRGRNYFEYLVHVAVAAAAVNWFAYYVVLYWLVAYRYLDVGPRRLLQRTYNTPAKLAARPWAPLLNWAVITALYLLTLAAVLTQQIIYAVPPPTSTSTHAAAPIEIAVVVIYNLVVAVAGWAMIRRCLTEDPRLITTPSAASTRT